MLPGQGYFTLQEVLSDEYGAIMEQRLVGENQRNCEKNLVHSHFHCEPHMKSPQDRRQSSKGN
jgi:hypothetical protein